jgi:hypothetical protein
MLANCRLPHNKPLQPTALIGKHFARMKAKCSPMRAAAELVVRRQAENA